MYSQYKKLNTLRAFRFLIINCYYKWSGLVPWDWAIGSVQIKAPGSSFSLPPNANNLFFNMGVKMVKNTGPENCFFQLWFDEDDNGDGIFDENTEDRFIYEYWYENDDSYEKRRLRRDPGFR